MNSESTMTPWCKGRRVLYLTDHEVSHVPLSGKDWGISDLCNAAVIANNAILKMMGTNK